MAVPPDRSAGSVPTEGFVRLAAMTSPRPLALSLLAAVLVAACGAPSTSDVAIDSGTAEALAGRADRLAADLDAGDGCAALDTAAGLVAAAEDGLVDGSVPGPVATEIIRTTRSAVTGVDCAPAPEPPDTDGPPPDVDAADRDDDEGRDDEGKKEDDEKKDDEKERGKGNGKGEGKDERGSDDDDSDG